MKPLHVAAGNARRLIHRLTTDVEVVNLTENDQSLEIGEKIDQGVVYLVITLRTPQ